MILDARNLLPNVWLSLRDPRGFASSLFSAGIGRDSAWRLLLLTALLNVFVNHFATLASFDPSLRPTDDIAATVLAFSAVLLANPFLHATVSLSFMVICVYVTFWAGRWGGGTGELSNAVLAVAWVGFAGSVLGLVQLLTWVLLAPLAGLVSLGVTVASIWLFTNFVAELHSFRSLFATFAGIIAAFIGVTIGFSLLIVLVAVILQGG